jgi:hypothetical protein
MAGSQAGHDENNGISRLPFGQNPRENLRDDKQFPAGYKLNP